MRLNYPDRLSYEPFYDYIIRKGTEYTIRDDAPKGMKEEFEKIKKEREEYTENHGRWQ